MRLEGQYIIPSGFNRAGELLESAIAVPDGELDVSSKDSSLAFKVYSDKDKSVFILDFVCTINTPVKVANGEELSEDAKSTILSAVYKEAIASMCPAMKVIYEAN